MYILINRFITNIVIIFTTALNVMNYEVNVRIDIR